MKLGVALLPVVFVATAANADTPIPATPFSRIEDVTKDPKSWHIPADSYTRLEITGAKPDEQGKALPYAKRPPLLRAVWGKRYVTAATLKVSAGSFVATVPLLTIDHESSGKKGEVFLRANARTAFDFPLFLAPGDAQGDVASFEVQLAASDATESSAAVLAIGAAEKLLKVMSPSSGVVTKLTEDRTRELAGAADASFGQLFSSSVTERQRFDLKIRHGGEYRITIYAPKKEGGWKVDPSAMPDLIGTWDVKLANARPSLFSLAEFENDVTQDKPCSAIAKDSPCDKALRDGLARPFAILSFKLYDGVNDVGSISSFLRQQTWWTSMLPVPAIVSSPASGVTVLSETPQTSATAAGKIKADDPKIIAFCRKIRSAMVEIGLNGLDSRLVTHAVGKSPMVDPAIGKAMGESADCQASREDFDTF